MATTWNQGAPPQNQYPPPPTPQRRTTNPPPVCFNCGVEGHFVVNCPQQSRSTPAGFSSLPPPPTTPYQQFPVPGLPAQQYQPRPGPPQAQYAPYPTTTQYGQQAPQQPYNQPQQAYAVQPPVNPHTPFVRPGYQPPAYNPNAQAHGPPQFANQSYQGPHQNYGSQGPVPYQAPPNSFTPQTPGYSGPPSSFAAPPQQQWNNQNAQPYQQTPQRSASISSSLREYPRTPSHQPQQQVSQPPQQMTPGPNQTPQTPLSSTSTSRRGQWPQNAASSPIRRPSVSKTSSSASTVAVPLEANNFNAAGFNSVTPHEKQQEPTLKSKKEEIPEDGEVTELDNEQEQWEWDYKHIFPDSPVHETVALAQPLGTGFSSTPVPLIQSWSTNLPSISRYARKDNVKEFVRSIRVSPQWTFVREDPAFNDSTLDGPLIPIDEVFEWAAARHAKDDTAMHNVEHEELETEGGSRKRLRPEDFEDDNSEQEDVDNQIKLEARSDLQNDGPRNKRQKNVDYKDHEVVMQAMHGSTTPVLANARGGTPYLPTDDDAWAPQPGERASSPGDPTEALLASLGVSGSPKPVQANPSSPNIPSQDQSPLQRQSQTPVASQTGSVPPPPPPLPPPPPPPQASVRSQAVSIPPQSSQTSHVDPPNFVPPQPNSAQNSGPLINNTYPVGQSQYGPPVNQQYGNGQHLVPQNMNGTPQNRPPINPPFQNGPPVNIPYQNPQNGPMTPQGPPSYGSLANQPYYYGPQQSYTHPQYQPPRPQYGNPTPYNGPQAYPQYGPPQTAPYGPQQYGPPVNAPHPQGPPANAYQQHPQQYGPPRNPSYVSGPPPPNPYGPQQYSPAQYGPPQNQPYVNQPYPNQPYHNAPNSGFVNGPGPQNNVPFQNGQTVQGPFPGLTGQMPQRQDSGYGSARGSYSNGGGGDGPSNFNGQNAAYSQGQQPNFDAQNGPQPQTPQIIFNSQNNMQEQGQQAGPTNHPQQQQNPQNNSFNPQTGQNGAQTQIQQGSFIAQNMPQQQDQQQYFKDAASNQNQPEQPSPNTISQDEASTPNKQINPPNQDNMQRKGSIDMGSMGDSPLSPTSAEILGKLEGKPNTTRADHSRRKKKPQPVVAAAYSRRW